jgi:hypothetical protein
MIKRSISDIFFRNPCVSSLEAIEELKNRNVIRGNVFTNAILKGKLKVLVGSELTYQRNYVKTKLFNVSKATKNIHEFSKHLFGCDASYDNKLKESAASLRYFRDENYPSWKDDIETNEKGFCVTFLRNFYDDYSKFVTMKCEEYQMNKELYFEALLASDIEDFNE